MVNSVPPTARIPRVPGLPPVLSMESRIYNAPGTFHPGIFSGIFL